MNQPVVRLQLKQAAQMLQLNPKTVVKLIKGGKLRGFKLYPHIQNSKWIIPSDAIHEYLAYQSALTAMPSEPKTLHEVFTGEIGRPE